jgi:hypothetical protein
MHIALKQKQIIMVIVGQNKAAPDVVSHKNVLNE